METTEGRKQQTSKATKQHRNPTKQRNQKRSPQKTSERCKKNKESKQAKRSNNYRKAKRSKRRTKESEQIRRKAEKSGKKKRRKQTKEQSKEKQKNRKNKEAWKAEKPKKQRGSKTKKQKHTGTPKINLQLVKKTIRNQQPSEIKASCLLLAEILINRWGRQFRLSVWTLSYFGTAPQLFFQAKPHIHTQRSQNLGRLRLHLCIEDARRDSESPTTSLNFQDLPRIFSKIQMFELHIYEEHWVAQISILLSKNLSLSSSNLVEIAFEAQFHASLLLLGQQLVWDDVQIGLEFLQAGPLRCHINIVEAVVVYAKPYGKAWQGMASWRQPKWEFRQWSKMSQEYERKWNKDDTTKYQIREVNMRYL